MQYHAPWWLPGGHTQTIWPAFLADQHRGSRPVYARELWATPDGDRIAVDTLRTTPPAVQDAPLLILFHGLEGSSGSHYALAWADWCRRQGWQMVVPHFRGCGGIDNLAPRAYHSGDHAEIDWVLAMLAARHAGPRFAVGVSLGGNALLRWAAEAGDAANRSVQALAAISAPLDLPRCGHAMDRGLNRWFYTRSFLATMKPKALRKLQQHPGLFDREQLLACRTLYAFDNLFTAPLHGFQSTDDYWRRAAARPTLRAIRLPTLALNALNDPFVPADALPTPEEAGTWVTLWQPAQGGHVGFAQGRWPGQVWGLADTVGTWLQAQFNPPTLARHG